MNYMFLLYADSAAATPSSPEDRERRIALHSSIIHDAQTRGVFKGASPLQPVSTAVTARRENGEVTVTDGPFVETKEALGGYYLLECRDTGEAEYWGRRLATTGCVSAVEFRALAAMPEPMQRAVNA